MKNEKPILFTGPMVRAILDGRKTQTRRLVKPQPQYFNGRAGGKDCGRPITELGALIPCRHGEPGDQLWVKETFRPKQQASEPTEWIYRADEPALTENLFPWKPSIFCTRKASRITLEIVAVRVERLQDISASDARAEGMRDDMIQLTGEGRAILARQYDVYNGDRPTPDEIAIAHYRGIWETINGPGSWNKNPWVWVIEFKAFATGVKN